LSALYVDLTDWIPMAVLAASFLGSGHCATMCGGLVTASARSRKTWSAYQLGRLTGYLALGSLAGWVGGIVLSSGPAEASWMGYASWGAAFFLGSSFFLSAIRIWQGRALHFPLVPKAMTSWLYKRVGANSWLLGLLTALLPCGWLHSFILGAVATRDPLLGAGFLFAFWLGGVPALGLTPLLADRILRPISRRSPKIAAMVLISAGLASVGAKVFPAMVSDSAPHEQQSCH
jgi:uncharacterized protein